MESFRGEVLLILLLILFLLLCLFFVVHQRVKSRHGAGRKPESELQDCESVNSKTQDLTEVARQLDQYTLHTVEDICFCSSNEIIR